VPQESARRAALVALRRWRTQSALADAIIGILLADSKLSAADRAFALELFYGVLRNLSLLDYWIRSLRHGRVDVDLADILRLGLYQLLLADVREHAAVYESVELTSKRQRGVVNAVLRAAVRQRSKLMAQAEALPLAVKTSHPEFLVERWTKNFGEEDAAQLCRWNNEPPRVYGRVNRLKIPSAKFLEERPEAKLVPDVPGFVEFLRFPTNALAAGECYIQDPSTRFACELLAPEAGEKILDACAAPGGKTRYLAEQMANRGVIVTCDRQPDRLRVLEENMQRLGVEIAHPLRHDWTEAGFPTAIASLAPFDRILIDAPCSNTGVMRRRVDVRWRLRPDEFDRMQRQQLTMIRAVTPLLKKRGALVYSTCSLEPEENRLLIERLQSEMSILQLEQEIECLPFRDGFDGAFAARLVKTD
jgi:16S rRNA (cytosine967-C5)-methyltransferase